MVTKTKVVRAKASDMELLTSNVVVKEDRVDIVTQLNPKDYASLKKLLVAAGCKWDRKAGTHLFVRPGARDQMLALFDTGQVVDQYKSLDFFPTPFPVIKHLIELAEIRYQMLCLEPSAGDGRLAEAMQDAGGLVCCNEIDEARAAQLKEKGFATTCEDFLTKKYTTSFERIVMNPPFSRGDDIRHVEKARQLLRPGGVLVSVVGGGPKQREFFSEENGWYWEDLPADSFKESGTKVNTAIVMYR